MNNDGKDLEKIVRMIEASIDSSASVEHDIQMPILTSLVGATAQCDIVIKKGKKPRETVTIVEVQDRNSQVDVNTFRGWMVKLDQIGAQHLICVSKKKFSKSIVEQASQSGTRISLVNIEEAIPESIPFKYTNWNFNHFELDIIGIENFKISPSEGQNHDNHFKEKLNSKWDFTTQDRIFSYDKKDLLTINHLVRAQILHKLTVRNEKRNISLGKKNDGTPLYMFSNKKFHQVELSGTIIYDDVLVKVPTSLLSYQQIDFGPLAWVWKGNHESIEGSNSIRITIVPQGKGYKFGEIVMSIRKGTILDLKLKAT